MAPAPPRPGRNDPCHCGSGQKYKKCCLEKDEAREAKARAKAEKQRAEEPAAVAAETRQPRTPKHQTQQPWKASTARGFIPRTRLPRKVGGS